MTLPFPSSLVPSNPLTGFRFFVALSEFASPARGPAHHHAGGGHRSGGSGGSAPARHRRPPGPPPPPPLPAIAGFSGIAGLDSSIEMFDYKEGGRNDYLHKFATRASFGNITFKRGVAVTPDLWQWFDKVRQGSFSARRGVMIAHLAADGTPALVWTVSRALPLKYVGPSWNAGQSSVAIESIEIAHEGLELIPTALGGI